MITVEKGNADEGEAEINMSVADIVQQIEAWGDESVCEEKRENIEPEEEPARKKKLISYLVLLVHLVGDYW